MKLLVLLSRVPYPLEKGDKLRAYYQLKSLSEKHEIILVALNDTRLHPEAKAALQAFCKEVHILPLRPLTIFLNLVKGLFSPRPLQVSYFYSRSAQQKIDALILQHQPRHIYCQLVRTAEYVKKHSAQAKTLDYMDALSKGVQRRISYASAAFKPILRLEYRRLALYEKEVFGRFTHKTIISAQDRDLIDHPEKDKIVVVPNGVDEAFMNYSRQPEKEYDLLFTGNMSYPPNVESAVYIVEKILPLVKKDFPRIRLMIAGTDPSPRVLALQSEHVSVSGWVIDMKEMYAKTRMVVAPMQTGTGLQNKLLEAMAMAVPCITSTLANNALCAVPGEQVLVAETPGQYADHISNLMTSPIMAAEMGRKGKEYIAANYSWKKANRELEKLLS